PEVEVTISVTVARNADEAQRLARGEDITVAREEGEEAAAAAAAEAFFEPEVIAARRTREAADETAPADAEAEKKWGSWLPGFPQRMGKTPADRAGTTAFVRGRADRFPGCRWSESTQEERGAILRPPPSQRYSSKSSIAFCRAGVATTACDAGASGPPPGAAEIGRLPASMLSEGRRGLTAPAVAVPGEGWPCSDVRRPLPWSLPGAAAWPAPKVGGRRCWTARVSLPTEAR